MKIRFANFFDNRLCTFLFILIPTLVLYFKSLSFGFTLLDEKWLIIDNAEYLKTWQSLRDAFSTSLYHIYYRPLLAVSIFIDYSISGLSPAVYHITNLAWHLLCVFGLLRLLKLYGVPNKNAAMLALLFSLHPMAVHAVAWVPGRNDLMLAAFTLYSLICLKIYADTSKPQFLFLHLLLFACALLTKENAVVLPVIFLASVLHTLPKKRIFVLISFWFGLAMAWFFIRNTLAPAWTSSSVSIGDRIINFISGFLSYFGKCIFPWNQSVYPIANNLSSTIGLGAIILLIILFWKYRPKNSMPALTGILFFVLLIPPLAYSSGRSNPDFFEHRAYTSLCGLILFLSQLKFNFNSKAVAVILGVIIVVLSIKSFLRINAYKNEETFLSYGVKEAPSYFLFQAQYAGLLSSKGNFSEALPYYDKVIALRPDKAEFFNDRGHAHFALGQYHEAISDISRAIQISGFSEEYYFNRCMAYAAAGETENAMKDLYVLMKCCRERVPQELKNEVGTKWRAIMKQLNEQITANPNNGTLLFKRANLYFDTGQKKLGFADLEKAMALSPGNPEYRKLYQEQIIKNN
jgi:tetratricopeptide (TPR) repeat protein